MHNLIKQINNGDGVTVLSTDEEIGGAFYDFFQNLYREDRVVDESKVVEWLRGSTLNPLNSIQ